MMKRMMMRSDNDWCIALFLAFVVGDGCIDRRNIFQNNLQILVGLIVVLGYMLRSNLRRDRNGMVRVGSLVRVDNHRTSS